MKNLKLIKLKSVSQNLGFLKTLCLSAAIAIASINSVEAQIPANAVAADPSAKSVTQVPLSSVIIGDAVLKFKFTNENSSTNNTGQIPAGSVRLTISFPGNFYYLSPNDIPKFIIEDADPNPFGTVHLVNNALILENEIIDLLLNVRATSTTSSAGAVTFNSDRTTPIRVANLSTANDNSTSSFTTQVVLPVSLVDFKAEQQGCSAMVSWKTNSEVNVKNYTVQASTDNGFSFTEAGVKAALNNNRENTYLLNFTMDGASTYFYRLKITDNDGQIKYSDIFKLKSTCGKAGGINVFPSPATSIINLSVTDPAMINKRVAIIDVAGRIYQSFNLTSNYEMVSVENLPKGIYILRFENGQSTKFVKL